MVVLLKNRTLNFVAVFVTLLLLPLLSYILSLSFSLCCLSTAHPYFYYLHDFISGPLFWLPWLVLFVLRWRDSETYIHYFLLQLPFTKASLGNLGLFADLSLSRHLLLSLFFLSLFLSFLSFSLSFSVFHSLLLICRRRLQLNRVMATDRREGPYTDKKAKAAKRKKYIAVS